MLGMSRERMMTMTGLDIFAWIVLIVLVASTVFVVVFMAMLPGMIAKKRNHPWAEAVTVAGWVTLFFGFVLWPVALIWAYVDVPRAAQRGGGAMIVVLLNVYLRHPLHAGEAEDRSVQPVLEGLAGHRPACYC